MSKKQNTKVNSSAIKQKNNKEGDVKKQTKTAKVVKKDKVMTFNFKSVISLFTECLSLKADELNYKAMTYLALTLIKADETIMWKDLVVRFNKRSKGMPTASMFSDTWGREYDGWNLRNQLWEMEHHVDTGCHAEGKGQLTLRMVNADKALVAKLHAKFFKSAK